MKIETSAELAALVDTLKARGVRAFSVDGIRVEFAPAAEPTPIAGPAEADPEICNCKCPVYAHVNRLCINGCEPGLCAGPEETPDGAT